MVKSKLQKLTDNTNKINRTNTKDEFKRKNTNFTICNMKSHNMHLGINNIIFLTFFNCVSYKNLTMFGSSSEHCASKGKDFMRSNSRKQQKKFFWTKNRSYCNKGKKKVKVSLYLIKRRNSLCVGSIHIKCNIYTKMNMLRILRIRIHTNELQSFQFCSFRPIKAHQWQILQMNRYFMHKEALIDLKQLIVSFVTQSILKSQVLFQWFFSKKIKSKFKKFRTCHL